MFMETGPSGGGFGDLLGFLQARPDSGARGLVTRGFTPDPVTFFFQRAIISTCQDEGRSRLVWEPCGPVGVSPIDPAGGEWLLRPASLITRDLGRLFE